MFENVDARVPENKHDAINDFLQKKHSVGVSENTLEKYAYTFRLFFHECQPDVTPADAEIQHFEEFLQWLDTRYREKHPDRGRGLKDKTKRARLDPLSSFYTWAMKRPQYDEIASNPAGVVMSELPNRVEPRPDCATWSNAKKIIHSIPDPRNKTVAVILAKTGCRLTEALEIKEADLMLERGFIRLQKRKGGKQTVVPVDDETIYQIRRYRKIQHYPDHEYLFVSQLGNRLSRQQIQDAVRDAAIQTGVIPDKDHLEFHEKFTPHTFRTVFTTLMRNQGMSQHILKYIRGDSPKNMIDLYTRVDRDEARKEYLECIKTLNL